MSDDLDLRGIDRRHEPDPQFRSSLRVRLVAIVEGADPTEASDQTAVTIIELDGAERQADPTSATRWFTLGTIRIASAAAIVALLVALIVAVRSRDDGTSPADTPSVSTSIYDGWVAFTATDDPEADQYDDDVYVVREGSLPRRVAGSDTDELVHVCPVFSPDASQLVYGQATGSEDTAYHDAALVITDVTADGELSATATIPLGGETPPPCGIWSADGRWVAFEVDTPLIQGPEDADGMNPREPTVGSVDEVWVVDTQSDDIRRLTGLFVTDLDWAPNGSELALTGDGVSLYSVASDEIRPLGGAGAGMIDWSPDGRTIAFARGRSGARDSYDLWLMDADGTNERILVAGVRANHGAGPKWSPDGRRIVYQQLCTLNNLGGPCREEHEVVVVTVNDDVGQPATEVVLPLAETSGPDGPISWYPDRVIWSADGTALHYFALGANTAAPSIERSAILAVHLDGTTPTVVLTGDLTV